MKSPMVRGSLDSGEKSSPAGANRKKPKVNLVLRGPSKHICTIYPSRSAKIYYFEGIP